MDWWNGISDVLSLEWGGVRDLAGGVLWGDAPTHARDAAAAITTAHGGDPTAALHAALSPLDALSAVAGPGAAVVGLAAAGVAADVATDAGARFRAALPSLPPGPLWLWGVGAIVALGFGAVIAVKVLR